MPSSTYGETTLNKRTCRKGLERFKSSDFNVEDRHSGGKNTIFEDFELESLLAGIHCLRTATSKQGRMGFLHRIVTSNGKWVHDDYLKRRKSWGIP